VQTSLLGYRRLHGRDKHLVVASSYFAMIYDLPD